MRIPIEHFVEQQLPSPFTRQVAKVLLADAGLASRLSLRSLFVAAGYDVDGAASSAEAVSRLDGSQYQLVLADLRAESEEAGSQVLAYARQKDYRPATALISSEMSEMSFGKSRGKQRDKSCDGGLNTPSYDDAHDPRSVVRISDENVSYLLANVANLIGDRASRRMRRSRPAS